MSEALIDVVEPFFRVLVELGYDRSIPLWEPTPARLIPKIDAGKVAADLVSAIGEGFNNALALVGAPPATEPAKADPSPQMTTTETDQVKTETKTARADVFSRMTAKAVSKDRQATSTQTLTQTNLAAAAGAGVSELSSRPMTGASTTEQAQPTGRSARSWPPVRGSFGAGLRLAKAPHGGDGQRPNTLTARRLPDLVRRVTDPLHVNMTASS